MTVVLLHASPLDERMWEPQREALADLDIVAPNLYRLGANSMDRWAQRILDDAAGELVAVGASMGGYVALAMARLAPERVLGLLLAGARPDADSAERRAGRADSIRLVETEGAAGLWESMRPKLFADEASEEIVELAREMALAREPAELVRALEAIRDRPDSTEVVRSLSGPVLFALGAGDGYFTVDEARAVADETQRDLIVFERSRHLPSLEQPEEFNRMLLGFLQAAG